MNLKQHILNGIIWSAIARSFRIIVQFIVTAVLAHYLSPVDFGLIGMVTVFTGLAFVIGDLGLTVALVQKTDVDEIHYSTVFWLNLGFGLILATFFFFLSNPIAVFYSRPQLVIIVRVISLNFLLTTLPVIQRVRLQKAMNFRIIAISENGAVLIAGVASVAMAMVGFGVWSLVAQQIIIILIESLILWSLSSWRPQLIVSKRVINNVFKLSSHMTLFKIINYIADNVDYLLIGKFLGEEALGFYTLAYKIMLQPVQNITQVIGRVMFPAFAIIQKDLEKIKTVYLELVHFISLITFPVMLGLIVIAPLAIEIIFGLKWVPVVPILQILSIVGMIKSINSNIGNIIVSQGRTDLQLKLGCFSLCWLFLAIMIGINWSINGVAISICIASMIWQIYSQKVANAVILLKNSEFYLSMKNTMLSALLMMAMVYILKLLLSGMAPIITLAILIISGMIIYILLMVLLKDHFVLLLIKKIFK